MSYRWPQILSQSFLLQDHATSSFKKVLVRQVVFSLLVVSLVVILNPDLYGLLPNSLDPIFYTGYAINFDDALASAGNNHYFVTRWTSYLPQYVFSQMFGPYWGRLILRMLMMSVLSEVFWKLGERFKFTATARISSFLLVLFSPMFLRAFTTDYQEYTATFYGILLVWVVLSQNFQWRWGLLVGLFCAVTVISNPFNFGLISISCSVWFLRQFRQISMTQVIATIFSALASFSAVVLFGYLLFRFHYEIGNVYEPTLKFIREYTPPSIDLWTAPGRQWLWHFGWLYIPLLSLVLVPISCRQLDMDSKLFLRSLSIITGCVYTFHIYMQVTRGHALETSYYWAMALPPLYLLIYLLIGVLATDIRRVVLLLSIGLLVISIVRLEIPQIMRIGAGWPLFVFIALITFLVFLSYKKFKVFSYSFLVIGLIWIQIGSPSYKVLTYGGDLNSPRYDLVFGKQAATSRDVLSEIIWFTKEMDQLNDDWKSTFLSAGGWSSGIVGTYIPHPFSRWIVSKSNHQPLSNLTKYEFEFGSRKYLAIFGDRNEVQVLLDGVSNQLPRSKILLDETHSSGLRYRLVVLRGNSEAVGSAQIVLSELDRNVGKIQKDGSVKVSAGSTRGFATFGPYFTLGPGNYSATIRFTVNKVERYGRFEVFNDRTQTSYSIDLNPTSVGSQEKTTEFKVTELDSTWQLRTEYSGTSDLEINQISLTKK